MWIVIEVRMLRIDIEVVPDPFGTDTSSSLPTAFVACTHRGALLYFVHFFGTIGKRDFSEFVLIVECADVRACYSAHSRDSVASIATARTIIGEGLPMGPTGPFLFSHFWLLYRHITLIIPPNSNSRFDGYLAKWPRVTSETH